MASDRSTLLDSRKNGSTPWPRRTSSRCTATRTSRGGPDNFYHMMVVDAFSSDAIPAHLITKEAIEMYFTKLSEKGILCVHTSNRFVNLPKVVAAVGPGPESSMPTRRATTLDQQRGQGHHAQERRPVRLGVGHGGPQVRLPRAPGSSRGLCRPGRVTGRPRRRPTHAICGPTTITTCSPSCGPSTKGDER